MRVGDMVQFRRRYDVSLVDVTWNNGPVVDRSCAAVMGEKSAE